MKSRLEQFVELNPWIFKGLDLGSYGGGCSMLTQYSGTFRIFLDEDLTFIPDIDGKDLYKMNETELEFIGFPWESYFINPAYPTKAEQEMFNMLHPGHRFLFGEGIPEIIYPK